MEATKLKEKAKLVRQDIIRMLYHAGSGHPGGSLSCADIMTALYFSEMNIDPEKPDMAGRDRFVLSKGHAAPAQYAAMAERGYFPVEELNTLRKMGSRLQGHPSMHKLPGIEISTGSLGQGISAAVGMAIAGKLDESSARVYTILGDGEIQEGMVWEAAMAAAHHDVSNLIAIVDCNGVQINGWVNDILRIEPLADKWKAFGWNVIEINGHDMAQVLEALHRARSMRGPAVILSRTVKGKGVSFMEDNPAWHGSAPNAEQLEQALKEIAEGRDA